MSRRELVKTSAGVAASVAVGGALIGGASSVLAQDATPESGSAASAGATPEAVQLPAMPPELDQYVQDWPVAQANLESTRVASGGSIDSSNVSTLGVAWELPITASSPGGAITSNPVIQGDTVYIIDNAATIQAVNRETGEVKWKNEYNVATAGPNGVALGYGILVGVLGDAATVIALKPEDGSELWRFQLANHGALGITMAPAIFDGLVYVSTEPGGNSKGTYKGGANGVLYALDITNGQTLWTWDTVNDDLWGNFRVNSGGGLWYPPAIDPKTGILYMGIGNAGPFPGTKEFPNGSSRLGVNDYANNLVALDPRAGKILWSLNVKPRDIYDHDNQETPILGTVKIGDVDTEVVFTTGKHGYVVAAHRVSGQEFWRVAVGKHQNDGLLELPPDGLDILPGVLGGVNSPMAFKDGVVYVAAFNLATRMTPTGLDFAAFSGGYASATSNLVALDGATGRVIWDIALPYGVIGPGPTISGDLMFVGSLDGIVRAFTLADGKQVWTSQTSAGLNAPFAIADDMLFVPAGSVIAPSADSPNPVPGYLPAMIAYKLGASGSPTLGTPTATDSTPAANAGSSEAPTITMIDLAFQPNEITIAANTDVTVTLDNKGVLSHDFVIDDPKVNSGILNGGTSGSVSLNLAPGTYSFYCSVEGHAAAGMVGRVIAK
ncbi:MAG: PQQ-binding-like beta-propeller repeat protein [Thermomicrobiales bacterium]